MNVTNAVPGAKAGKPISSESVFAADEGPRADTSAAALAALKPVFHAQGTVTAGNSSQTSDGAAAAVLMDAARAQGTRHSAAWPGWSPTPLPAACRKRWASAPSTPFPRRLSKAGLTLDDIGLIEFNEAFAAQALAVMRELGFDPAKVNVNGGAIALGHPLGCTGAKLTATLLSEMKRRKVRYGMVTMCVGGGHGRRGHLRAA